MSKLFKALLLAVCLVLTLSIFVACDKNDDQPADTTPPQQNAETPEAPTIETPEIVESVKFAAVDQKSENGKIEVQYSVPAVVAADYTAFSVDVYHGEYPVASTAVDAKHPVALVDGTYGKLNLKLVGTKADATKVTLAEDTVSVWTDRYNFASLNATFPVTYFTLDMFSMGEAELPGAFSASAKKLPIMEDVPTFISLERAAAYSWADLPENVYQLPNVSAEMKNPNAANNGDLWHARNNYMASYIKELYEINPDSFFNFYCVDIYPDLILRFFYAQGIPAKNFHATMISDGVGTAIIYSEAFSVDNAATVYENMEKEWDRLKTASMAGEPLGDIYNIWHTVHALAKYPPIIAADDNVDWWCSRDLFSKDLYTGNAIDAAVYDKIKALINDGSLRFFGINDMLSILDKDQQTALKKLFHFDSDMFAAADEAGKEALVIIGTDMAYEDLERYIKLTSNLYGDDYVIYYKGHPGYPVDANERIMNLFAEYGVINLDASIAAELILFYCPDIYLVGWSSSTFKSVQTDRFLAIFQKNEATYEIESATQGYGDDPDFYCTYLNNGYIQIEYDADETVKYYDIANDQILDTLPTP